MSVKLIDLQLIYGVAGARERFEDLAAQLVLSEHPAATKVRTSQGDGGIDVHVGAVTDPTGIDVYQSKFFPHGLSDSQKDQIRESFKRCKGGKSFLAKSWTLCLPVDLSLEEKRWFEDWRAKQSSSKIIIGDVWGATKLEGLLYQDKNTGLRDEYFREDHLRQIREMHGKLQQFSDVVERLERDEREREELRHHSRRENDLAKQEEYLFHFGQAMREDYLALAHQCASALGLPNKCPAHWEVLIYPSPTPTEPYIRSLGDCWSAIKSCSIPDNPFEYPIISQGSRHTGVDWTGASWTCELAAESWRYSQRGLAASTRYETRT